MVRLPALFLPLLVACNEYRVNGPGADVPEGAPDIELDPLELDFGSIGQGSEVTRSLRISNRGNAALVVDALSVAGSTAFSVELPDALQVEPGSSVIHEIAWSPVEDIDEGILTVASNDPDESEIEVPLVGHGLFGQLTLSPDPLTFEELTIGCEVTQSVELRNDGEGLITVQGVSVTGTGFVLGASPTWPITLEPGDTSLVDVTFEPLAEDDAVIGTFAADSTDRRGRQTSALEGAASEPAHVVEEFQQATGSQIDLMFFIDSSCSMADDAENLAANFDLFLDELLSGGVDYNVMVVTNEDGCHNEEIITPLTPDPEVVFGEAIIGAGGMYSESGLVVTSLALAQSGAGACNDGFLRVGVPVVTVMVSDEPDFSPGTWLDQVLAMQASAPDVVVNGVIGQIGSSCSASNGSGYHEAIAATGGVDLDICDADWGTYVSQILGTADLLSSFALSSIPNPDTIEVTVDGAPGVGWTYDGLANIVVFDSALLPPEGAIIEVSYDEQLTCP